MQINNVPPINDKGFILPVTLTFLTILAIVGSAGSLMAVNDLKFGASHKTSAQALYVAEAGVEEARGRMKLNAAHPINDGHPTQTQWAVFIGTDTKAQGIGYDSGIAMHQRVNSLQNALDYTVRVSHQTDGVGNILYYGDSDGDGVNQRNTTTGQNIYLLSSTGSALTSSQTIDAEVTRLPPITVPSALYVEALTTIQGNVDIDGNDSCGTDHKPGVLSTLAPGTVTLHGHPLIEGADGTTPNIGYNTTDMDVQAMVDGFKSMADFSYTVVSPTHTASTTPGPGDGWGVPTQGATLQDPSTCAETNVVHYDTQGTDITLSTVDGCGILLVEGDLEVRADFFWHGVVLATGSIIFTGGGNRNVTGAMVAGGSVDGDIIGGNVNLVYCSTAIINQTIARSLKLLTWREDL